MRVHVLAQCLGAVALLAGCAAYGPQGLQPGTPEGQITAKLGKPTGEYKLPDGSRRLEYAHGPMGVDTFMLDLNPDGSLKQWRQVLNEQQFNQIAPGMTANEILQTLGRPSEIRGSGLQKLSYWNYRYDTFQCRMFGVDIDASGIVKATGYVSDPLCDRSRSRLFK